MDPDREQAHSQGEESQSWVQVLDLIPICCVPLGRSLKLPDPLTPCLWNGDISGYSRLCPELLRESDEKMKTVKYISRMKGISKSQNRLGNSR